MLIVKRMLDVVLALIGLVVALPVIALTALLIVVVDRHSPFYLADRVTKDDCPFRMIKLRSMHKSADKAGIDIVGAKDQRVTKLGWTIRRYKIDELPQLWNVLVGDMSFVGPRPNTARHTAMLTPEERRVLDIKAGLTDLASIAFSRQAEFFHDSNDPEADYGVRMRPLKSALGIWYTNNWTPLADIIITALTVVSFVSYETSIKGVEWLLAKKNAPLPLIQALYDLRQGKLKEKKLGDFGVVDYPSESDELQPARRVG